MDKETGVGVNYTAEAQDPQAQRLRKDGLTVTGGARGHFYASYPGVSGGFLYD